MRNRRGMLSVIIVMGIVAIAYLSVSIYRQAQQLFPEISSVENPAEPVARRIPTPTSAKAVIADDAYSAGQKLFAENCTACHGVSGEGSSIAPALNAPEVRQMDSKTLQNIITFGRSGTAMPAWGTQAGGSLSAEQIGELVSLIRAGAWSQPLPSTAEAESFAGIPPQAISLYSQNCATCHGATGEGSPIAPPLNSPALRARMTAAALEATIRNGRPGTRMPAWGGILRQDDIAALATLIRHWDSLTPDQLQQMTQSAAGRFGGMMGGRGMMGGGMMGGRGMMGR